MALWSARHRWRVVIGWLLLVVLAMFVSSTVEADTNLKDSAPGESGEAVKLLEDRFGEEQEFAQEIVVFSHPSLNVDDPAYRETVEGVLAQLRGLMSFPI